jgi:hypothetical protein
MQERAAQDATLDWLTTAGGFIVLGGMYSDGHAHVYELSESFFTPSHGVIYAGALLSVFVLAFYALRNMRAGYTLWNSLPEGYAQAIVAAPLAFLGGGLDLAWHRAYGLEQGLNTLVSPTHLLIYTSMAVIFTSPLRAALFRREERSLVSQIPAILGAAGCAAAIMFITEYTFYPEGLMVDKPLPIARGGYSQDQLTLVVILYYRHLVAMLSILWQSILVLAPALYLIARLRLHAGALVIYAFFEKLFVSMSFSRTWGEFTLYTGSTLACGLVAEFFYRRFSPSLANPNALVLFGAIVPMSYNVAYAVLAVPLFGGTWWDPTFLFGTIAISAIAGALLAQFCIGSSRAAT